MFRMLIKNKKGQQVAEYALMIALVVAAIIAMQTYAQRSLQARIRDAGLYLTRSTNIEGMGNTDQYEPYYLNSDYAVTKDSTETERLDTNLVSRSEDSTRIRDVNGFQRSEYNGIQTP
jgi:Flp pilus assembly pilin Flp